MSVSPKPVEVVVFLDDAEQRPRAIHELLARLSPAMREMLGFGSNVTSSLESLYMRQSGIEPARAALGEVTPPLISNRARP